MKKILICALTLFLLVGCTQKKEKKTVKKNCIINKTYVDIMSDDTVDNAIIDGNIYSLSGGDTSNKYNVSVFCNDDMSDMNLESLTNISDIYIGSEYIHTCEITEDYTKVYTYNFSGEDVFSIKFDSSSNIYDIYNDIEDNTYIVYDSESDNNIYIGKYDKAGDSKSIYNLSDIISFDNYEEISNIAVAKNGDVYIVMHNYESSEYTLLKYNSDFTSCLLESGINDVGDNVNNIFINESGKLVLTGCDDLYCYINITDTQSNISEKYIELQGVQNVFNGANDRLFYVKDDKVISRDTVTDEEIVITEVEETVTDMYYDNGNLVFCHTDKRVPLSFKVTDTDNNISYENNFSLDKSYYPLDSCFSDENKVYMLLCDHDTYRLGVFDGDYSEYEIALEMSSGEQDYFTDYHLTADDKNMFFIYNNDVYVFNIESQKLENITDGKYELVKDICVFNERLFILYSENENINVAEYLKTENKINKLISPDKGVFSDNDSILPGNGEYIYFLNYGNKLCGYKEDLKCDILIDWSNTYTQMYIDSFFVVEKDKFLCVAEDKKVYIVENNADKTNIQLDIAFFGNTTAIYDLYMQKLSEQFDFKIKRYSDYDQNGDNGIGQFNLDIASGNIPDVIITGGGYADLDLYCEKGLLESLDKYIENDPSINRQDYLPNVFDLNSFDGNLYYITPQIYIKTIVSKESMDNPENPGFDELYDLLGSKYSGYDNNIFGLENNFGLLNYFLSVNKELQNAGNAGKYNYNNDDFKAILKIAKEYGYERKTNHSLEILADNFSSDKQIFKIYSFSGFDFYNIYEKYVIGDKISFTGVSADKSDNIAIECLDSLCITSSSENKEEAWRFVREFIMDDYQNSMADQIHFGFPVKYSALNRCLNNSQDENYIPEYLTLGNKEIKVGYISDETAENLVSCIEECNLKSKMDAKIKSIINEAAMLYFEDEKTIDETIEEINSKVNLYINEIK